MSIAIGFLMITMYCAVETKNVDDTWKPAYIIGAFIMAVMAMISVGNGW